MSHSLILAFDTDDTEFVRGFEAGRIYSALRCQPDEPIDFVVHGTNAEMLLRIAEACDRSLMIEEHENDWLEAYFGEEGTRG